MAAFGAMFGVPYIVIMVLAVQRIGTAVATVAVIFGQLAMSMLIDNFGWLNNPAIPFSPSRLGAVVCLIALTSFTPAAKPAMLATKLPYSGKEQRHRGDGDAKFLHLGFIEQMRLILQVHPVIKVQQPRFAVGLHVHAVMPVKGVPCGLPGGNPSISPAVPS